MERPPAQTVEHGGKGPVAGRVAFLDHLRIFAFMSVLISHTVYHPLADLATDPGLHATPRLLIGLLLPFIQLGGAGVVVFFLVSGYIITAVLRSEDPGTFAVKRFFRIYPLYIVAVLGQYAVMAVAGTPFSYRTMLIQLSLLGDLTGTPYSLGGVEWTLRIEIMFYMIMGILAWVRHRNAAFGHHYQSLAYLIILWSLALLPPLTSWPISWGHWAATGVVTVYFPFLMIGSMVFLYERSHLGKGILWFFIVAVFTQFYYFTPIYQPKWMEDHHALIALGVFMTAWNYRQRLTAGPVVMLLSGLTYSVYLFHNWFFFIVRDWSITHLGLSLLAASSLSFAVLACVCYGAMELIEKPGVALGKRVVLRAIVTRPR